MDGAGCLANRCKGINYILIAKKILSENLHLTFLLRMLNKFDKKFAYFEKKC